MAVFDWVESGGTALTEEPRFAETSFGDGYKERAPDGLNPITQRWQVQFRGIDHQAADDIVAFFRARVSPISGFEAFDWTPLWHTEEIRVVCKSWNRTSDNDPNTCSVVAAFEQVHEP